jgi:hypothetical protein
MRSGYKTLTLGIGSLILTAAMVVPSHAGKQVITDSEMDEVTAAGQPTVLKGEDIDMAAEVNIALGIENEAQQNVRALILNNVSGENQVATDMNIASGTAGGRQDNNITQSWGSTYDRSFGGGASTPSVTATARGGEAECNRSALICVPREGASQTATATGASTPSIRSSIYADQIILADGDLDYTPETRIEMRIENVAQQGLSALVVNNVAGLNQVASGLNIAGNVGTGAVGSTGGGNVTIDGAGSAAGQGNIINQFRGTPFARPQ